MKKLFVLIVVYLCTGSWAIADKIVTISGNRYEGKIIKINEQVLEIETEDSFIEVERDKIQSIIMNDGVVSSKQSDEKPQIDEMEEDNNEEISKDNYDNEDQEAVYESNRDPNELLVGGIEKTLHIKGAGSLENRVSLIESKMLGATYIDNIDLRIKRLLDYLDLDRAKKCRILSSKSVSVPVDSKKDSIQFVEYLEPVSNNSKKQCKLAYNYVPMYGDYVNTVTSQQMLDYVWDKCPLTISLHDVPVEHQDKVIESFEKWAKYMPIKLVDGAYADIVFKWTKRGDLKKISNNKRSVGLAQHHFDNSHVCTIYILDQKKYPKTQLEHTIMHELGHAFGLGHSNNKNDLMYPINSAMKGGVSQFLITNISFIPIIIPTRFRKATHASLDITVRDANTLWQIYNPGDHTWRD